VRRWAGQDALHRVAGKIAGLARGVDPGRTDAITVGEVGEFQSADWADLYALAALDAGGEEVVLLQGAGRAQTYFATIGQRQPAGTTGGEKGAPPMRVRRKRRRACSTL